MKKEISDALEFHKRTIDPFFFIEAMWDLTPQPAKPEYAHLLAETPPEEWEAIWFGDSVAADTDNGERYYEWTWHDFQFGKHITWQQTAILTRVRDELAKAKSLKDLLEQLQSAISIASGHGIGKSALMSWLILQFLFRFPDCQAGATAPTAQQMHDILWKEMSKWISRMPKIYGDLYEWKNDYIRMKDNPREWFARAATGKKENPEALAGLHANHVLLVADEASGVESVVYETMEGAMTGKHILFIMISNPTRNTGYFKDSHKSENSAIYHQFSFNCEESPVVEKGYVRKMASKYRRDEDNFRFRVLGLFPKEDAMDDKGWMPLISETLLKNAFIDANTPFVAERLGVDPSGSGSDKSAWCGRSHTMVKILAEEKVSTPLSGTQKTLTLATEHEGIPEGEIFMDTFGIGSDWIQPLAAAGKSVKCINTGKPPLNKSDYINLRAQGAWEFRTFLVQGGQIPFDERWMEVLNIQYRRTGQGKIQIKSKEEMKKNRIMSPNFFDATCLTFLGKLSQDEIEEHVDAEEARLLETIRRQQMQRG